MKIIPIAEKDENNVLKPGTDARQRDAPEGNCPELDDSEKKERISGLTKREHIEGYTLRETAARLKIAYSTANTHQMAIYKKLGVNSKAELIINFRNFRRLTDGVEQ